MVSVHHLVSVHHCLAILDSLVKVLNCSIKSSACPLTLKLARVTPIHKSGSFSDPNNFRPISVLPIISKLLEKHVSGHLMNYLREYKLLISTQSGFRSLHSTESILIKMTDDWLEAMDKVRLTGVIFIDLHKAFDLVNHEVLLAKLRIYGFSPSTLRWFMSYLNDRHQQVSLNGELSERELLTCGVPKDSILGPTLSCCLSTICHCPAKAKTVYLLMMQLVRKQPKPTKHTGETSTRP